MSKILITGGAGFIGFHLANKLVKRGDKVDLLDNFSRAVADPDFDALIANENIRVLDKDLLAAGVFDDMDRDYDYIYHFAAIIGVTHVMNRPYDVLADNVEMTDIMLDYAGDQKALKRFLFTSTSEIYAGTLKHFDLPIPTPESTPLGLTALEHPRTSYMLSKIYGEALCLHSKVPVTILRPHNVYGPRMGMAHVVPELLKKAYNLDDGSSMEVFSVDHRRAFCYIDDAIDMIIASCESDKCENIALNLGNQAAEVSMGDVANVVVDVVGKKLTLDEQPAQAGSPARRCPDMSLMSELTGITASIDLHNGISKTFDWYKKNVFDGHGVTAK